MSDQGESSHAQEQSQSDTSATDVRSDRTDAMPPRPEMSDRTPAPIRKPAEPPRALKVARGLFLSGIAVALIVVIVAFLNRDSRIEQVLALVTERDPTQSAESLETVSAIVFWGSIGGLLLVVLLEALLMNILMKQHGSARWLLLIMLLVHSGVTLLAAEFLVPSGDNGIYVLLALGIQIPLIGVGLLLSFLPSVGTWLRSRRQPALPFST